MRFQQNKEQKECILFRWCSCEAEYDFSNARASQGIEIEPALHMSHDRYLR